MTPTSRMCINAIRVRTSPNVLHSTRMGKGSQKCEAVNHAFSMTNPKHTLTFYRNGKNCDASSVHIISNDPGTSIARKLKSTGIPMSLVSPAVKWLQELDRRQKYHRLSEQPGDETNPPSDGVPIKTRQQVANTVSIVGRGRNVQRRHCNINKHMHHRQPTTDILQDYNRNWRWNIYDAHQNKTSCR